MGQVRPVAWLSLVTAGVPSGGERSHDGGDVSTSKWARIILAAALSAGLVGCGSPSADTSLDATMPAWSINEVPRDQLAAGTLVVATPSPISNWNLASVDGSSQEAAFLLSPITPNYYVYDGSGVATMNPDYLLAADPQIEDAADGQQLVVTLTLNPKAVWNDGTPIDAADWVATWKALNGSNSAFLVADTTGWDQLASVSAGKDAFQVVLRFTSTYPDWTGLVAGGWWPDASRRRSHSERLRQGMDQLP